MNVDELDQHGVRIAAWCFGPEGELPIGDVMLAQKIALENDERAALAGPTMPLAEETSLNACLRGLRSGPGRRSRSGPF